MSDNSRKNIKKSFRGGGKNVAAFALLAITATILAGCGGGAGKKVLAPKEEVKWYEPLMKAVPSDAVAVSIGAKASAALEPEAVFADLPLGALKDAQAAVSQHYTGELTPLAVVAAGKNGDKPEGLHSLELAAAGAGITTAFIPSEKKSGKANLLILSPSANLVAASKRNLDENASILDIDAFKNALDNEVPPKSDVRLFKNEASQYLLPKTALSRYVGRTVLCRFLSGAAQWTVLRPEAAEPSGNGEYVTYGVSAITGEDKSKYLKIFEGLEAGESKVAPLLPYRTSYVVDLPIASVQAWLAARAEWMDANSQTNQYKGQLRKAARKGQPAPEEWAKAMDIKEVAMVNWRGRQVLLVRPASPAVSHDVKPNPTPGYLAPLFGNAFKIASEASIACIGHWYIIGSEDDVKKFLSTERKLTLNFWPQKGVKFSVLADDYKAYLTKQGLKFEVYKRWDP